MAVQSPSQIAVRQTYSPGTPTEETTTSTAMTPTTRSPGRLTIKGMIDAEIPDEQFLAKTVPEKHCKKSRVVLPKVCDNSPKIRKSPVCPGKFHMLHTSCPRQCFAEFFSPPPHSSCSVLPFADDKRFADQGKVIGTLPPASVTNVIWCACVIIVNHVSGMTSRWRSTSGGIWNLSRLHISAEVLRQRFGNRQCSFPGKFHMLHT